MRRFLAIALGVALAGAATVALAGRNSSGTMSFTSVAGGYPFVSGQVISSSGVNANMAELSSEITDSLSRSGKGGMTAPLRTADGSVGSPSWSWTSDTNTGLYRIGADNIGISLGGTKKVDLSAGAAAFTDPVSFLSSTTTSGIARFPGTISGDTTFNDAVTFASSVTISGIGNTPNAPTLGNHLANKTYVDGGAIDPVYTGTNWTPTSVSIHKSGKLVTFRFLYTSSGVANRQDVMRLPSGARPSGDLDFTGWLSTGVVYGAVYRINANGTFAALFFDDNTASMAGHNGNTGGAGEIFAGSVTFYADGN